MLKIDLYFILVPVLLCILLYFFNEDSIDKFDIDMKKFLINNKDDDTMLRLSKEKFTINKVTILLNKFYSTNDPQYISFAIRIFIIRLLLILAIVIGITIAIFAYLVQYLFCL